MLVLLSAVSGCIPFVHREEWVLAINETTDYDTNDDGVLDLPAGAQVLDAVGWTDGGGGDVVYGPRLLQTNPTPQAASRILNDDGPGNPPGGNGDGPNYPHFDAPINNLTVTPEPSTLLLLASGIVGLGAAMRRRRGKSQRHVG